MGAIGRRLFVCCRLLARAVPVRAGLVHRHGYLLRIFRLIDFVPKANLPNEPVYTQKSR